MLEPAPLDPTSLCHKVLADNDLTRTTTRIHAFTPYKALFVVLDGVPTVTGDWRELTCVACT